MTIPHLGWHRDEQGAGSVRWLELPSFSIASRQAEGGRVPGTITNWVRPGGRLAGDPGHRESSTCLGHIKSVVSRGQPPVSLLFARCFMRYVENVCAQKYKLSTSNPQCKQARQLMMDKQHTVGYCSATKTSEALTQVTTSVALEDMMLSEGNQTQTGACYITSFI